MKRFFASILYFILATFIFATDLNILSFNMAHLKRQNASDYTEWLDNICSIVKESKADIVYLQEVAIELEKIPNISLFKKAKANNILDDITVKLGKSWSYYSTADYAIRKNQTVENEQYTYCDMNQNNAILYNRNKVLAKDKAENIGFTTFTGKYLFDKNNVQVIEFSLVGQASKKFIAINVHLPYSNIEHRKRDMETLEKLYASYKLTNAVLIAGDFNTYRKDLIKRNFDFVDGTDSWYIDSSFGLKTTLTKNPNKVSFANDYDHFIYNKKISIAKSMKRAFISEKSDEISEYKIGKKFTQIQKV